MAYSNQANESQAEKVTLLRVKLHISSAGVQSKAFVGSPVHGQEGVGRIYQCRRSLRK